MIACFFFFVMLATITAYFQAVWEYQDYYTRPRHDTKPIYPIERPTPPAEAA